MGSPHTVAIPLDPIEGTETAIVPDQRSREVGVAIPLDPIEGTETYGLKTGGNSSAM